MSQETTIGITTAHKTQEETVYTVSIEQNGSSSIKQVTLPNHYWQQFMNTYNSPEELIRTSILFLLEREPKESILSSFSLPVIQHYFPEYEETLLST